MSAPRWINFATEYALQCDICGQLISPGGFLHHRRRFEYHVLIFVQEGTLYLTSNGIPYEVLAGQYILLKAGEEHYGHQESTGPLSYVWVHFSEKEEASEEEENCSFPEYGEVRAKERLWFQFRQIINLSMEENSIAKQMQTHLVSLLLLELTREYQQETGKERLLCVVAEVEEWIKSNYYRNFTVVQLAEEFGYQADYLSSLFKKGMGVSIIKFTNQLRIKAAKQLLMNYELSIKEAAYSCGFSDEKYFMKVFKQYEGMTPTQYKKSVISSFL